MTFEENFIEAGGEDQRRSNLYRFRIGPRFSCSSFPAATDKVNKINPTAADLDRGHVFHQSLLQASELYILALCFAQISDKKVDSRYCRSVLCLS